jgi:mannitol operon repressor
MLGTIIRAFIVEHRDADKLLNEGIAAPLGSFSYRTLAAILQGLISEQEYKDCNIVRDIRNKFAHKPDISFADQSVKDKCSNLSGKNVEGASPQQYFIVAATNLIRGFTNGPNYVRENKLKYGAWPDW